MSAHLNQKTNKGELAPAAATCTATPRIAATPATSMPKVSAATTASATLNIRLPQPLKQRGGAVLQREGISVSEAVRRLYEYMAREQTLPDFLLDGNDTNEDIFQRRRNLLQSMVGILPADVTLEEAREARFTQHGV